MILYVKLIKDRIQSEKSMLKSRASRLIIHIAWLQHSLIHNYFVTILKYHNYFYCVVKFKKIVANYYRSIILAMIIMVLSLSSTGSIAPQKIPEIPHIDQFVHFLFYFAFSFILLLDFNKTFFTFYPGIIVPVIICLLYGGLMEMIQYYIPYREAEMADLIFNLLGTGIGLVIYFAWKQIKY